jgi:hypothetical protein
VFVVPAVETTRKGRRPARVVGRDRVAQRVDAQAPVAVDRHAPHAVGQDAGQLRGLDDAHVRLCRGVEHALAQMLAEARLASRDDGREVGHRAAGREQAARARRESPSSP